MSARSPHTSVDPAIRIKLSETFYHTEPYTAYTAANLPCVPSILGLKRVMPGPLLA